MATTRKYDFKQYGRCYVVNSLVYSDNKPVLTLTLRTYPSIVYDVRTLEPYIPIRCVNQELSLFITRATQIVQSGQLLDYTEEDDIENRLFI